MIGVALSVFYICTTAGEVARGKSWWLGAVLSLIFVAMTVREARRTRHEQAREGD